MHKAWKRGVLHMEEKLIVSMRDGIAAISRENMMSCYAPLDGAGALCAGEKGIFCADGSGVIWRMDQKTLMPRTIACGGPGVCDLKLSDDQSRLFALLGDADCILMSDAHTGMPLAVNHCGCNPRSMVYAPGFLAAAGGESGRVHLFHPHTLEKTGEISMPGPVYSVALCGSVGCALCLSARLDTLLVLWKERLLAVLPLPGMPGCLRACGGELYIATEGNIWRYSITDGRIHRLCSAPGRASRMLIEKNQIVLYDPLSECVFLSVNGDSWRRLCGEARDIALVQAHIHPDAVQSA